MTHFHFIGIGGTGLSAIARVLFERGELVTGSDMVMSPQAQELIDMGVSVQIGHKPENTSGADIIIRSSAIADDNPEVKAANEASIPVLKRRNFLKELTAGKKVIAVAGTHGKTTTTAMIAWSLHASGFDPSYVIGSSSKNLGNNAHAGKGKYFVIEADEYDNMFLGLEPEILVITTIEHDHPDCFPTLQDYQAAFYRLAKKVPSNGKIILFKDDPGVQDLISTANISAEIVTYGISDDCDFQIRNINHSCSEGVQFSIVTNTELTQTHSASIPIPGNHNAFNATAALAVGFSIGAEINQAISALSQFSGTGRRFDIIGEPDGITLIDDYGHHPTEIRATLAGARKQYPNRNIWAVWQPHTYSRTQELFDDFRISFGDCDHVIVTEIYRSREKQQDYSSLLLIEKMEHKDKHFIASLEETTAFLEKNLHPKDVLIVLSAGDANQITMSLLEYFQRNSENYD